MLIALLPNANDPIEYMLLRFAILTNGSDTPCIKAKTCTALPLPSCSVFILVNLHLRLLHFIPYTSSLTLQFSTSSQWVR